MMSEKLFMLESDSLYTGRGGNKKLGEYPQALFMLNVI